MGTRLNLAATFMTVPVAVSSLIVNTAWNPFDPVGSFMSSLAELLRDWYAVFLVAIADIVTMVATPSLDVIVNDFFSFALGGVYGLARILVALFAVVVAIIIVVTPTMRHGVKINRVVVSLILVILFGYLFYPAYSLLYNLSKALTGAALSLIVRNDEDIAMAILRLFDIANAADAISVIISTGISGVLGVFIVGSAVGLFVLSMITLIFYPLAIAIRPLGEFGAKTFNLFNASLITTLFAPPFMAFFFVFPAFMQGVMPAVGIVATPFFAIVGSVLSLATPYVFFYMAFKKSTEVFGRLDDATGRFDVGEMPPVTVEEIDKDIQKTTGAAHMAVVADTIGDALLYGNNNSGGDFFDTIVKPIVDYGATAATAAGHPYMGMAAKFAASAYDRSRGTDDATESEKIPKEGSDG